MNTVIADDGSYPVANDHDWPTDKKIPQKN